MLGVECGMSEIDVRFAAIVSNLMLEDIRACASKGNWLWESRRSTATSPTRHVMAEPHRGWVMLDLRTNATGEELEAHMRVAENLFLARYA